MLVFVNSSQIFFEGLLVNAINKFHDGGSYNIETSQSSKLFLQLISLKGAAKLYYILRIILA